MVIEIAIAIANWDRRSTSKYAGEVSMRGRSMRGRVAKGRVAKARSPRQGKGRQRRLIRRMSGIGCHPTGTSTVPYW